MKFDKLRICPDLKSNLLQMGYHRTTDIQFKVIPAVLEGEDVLAIAQTGTGKTAAFAIPMISLLSLRPKSASDRKVRSLVVVPTRELAQQVEQVFSRLSKNTGVSSFAIHGGVEVNPQAERLLHGVDVLIATPGRMFELIRRKHIDVSEVQIFVLDEADRMLDLGFIQEIESIKRLLRRRHQTLFFSATISPKIKRTAYSLVRSNALRIQVSPENLVSRNVTHSLVNSDMDSKRHLLVNFFKANLETAVAMKCIIFVRTQVRAERVLAHLTKNSISALVIHGGMDQVERERSLEIFRESRESTLIATDISARGINVEGVTHVINYDLPDDPENYVHRVGRTGRGFSKGYAVSFCSPEETSKLHAIESFIQGQIPITKVDRVNTQEDPLRDIENIEVSEMLRIQEEMFANPKRRRRKTRVKAKTKHR